MGKKEDPKVPILPSHTRKGTVLNTSATLDSPSVMSKFASLPPHDASTTLDDIRSLSNVLEKQIAAAAKKSGIEIPDTCYPFDGTYTYPDLSKLKERLLDDDYIILDDDLCGELIEFNDSDPDAIKQLLEKHSLKNKTVPDPTFATSPIFITDPEFDFSIDLSLIPQQKLTPLMAEKIVMLLHI